MDVLKGSTGGVSPATHVILHRWQDTMPSRQQGLPEIEEAARKSDGGWERVITKEQHEREFKDEARLGKKNMSKEEWSEQN